MHKRLHRMFFLHGFERTGTHLLATRDISIMAKAMVADCKLIRMASDNTPALKRCHFLSRIKSGHFRLTGQNISDRSPTATRGLEKDLSTPSSSSRLFIVRARNSSRSLRLSVAVIGMQHQRLLPTLADSLSQAGPAHQIRCECWGIALSDIPRHHLATPDIDH